MHPLHELSRHPRKSLSYHIPNITLTNMGKTWGSLGEFIQETVYFPARVKVFRIGKSITYDLFSYPLKISVEKESTRLQVIYIERDANHIQPRVDATKPNTTL